MRRIFLTIAMGLLLTGCAPPIYVTEPYPRWQESGRLPRTGASLQRFPREAPRAALLMVHGMNEYIGRYRELAGKLRERGFWVEGVDLPAHGLTNTRLRQADEAIRRGAERFDVSDAYLEQTRLMRSLEPAWEVLEEAVSGMAGRCRCPVFLLTHSLGSLVAARWLLHAPPELKEKVAGVVFLTPAFAPTQVPGWRGRFQNPFIRLNWLLHRALIAPPPSPLYQRLPLQAVALLYVPLFDGLVELLSLPGIRRLTSPSGPPWVVDALTDWEPQKERQRRDGYLLRRAILRYVLEVLNEMVRFHGEMARFDLPYLLIYGRRDPITPAWGAEAFAEATRERHPENRVVPLEVAIHEPHFGNPELRERLFEEISRWLERLSGNRLREAADPSR